MKEHKQPTHFFRKDKIIGQSFAFDFTWAEASDAAADIYSGVRFIARQYFNWGLLILSTIVRVLVNVNVTWTYRLV